MSADVAKAVAADQSMLNHYGMEFVSAADGRALLRAVVSGRMVNAAGYANGALTFALADTACAYALNSAGARGLTLNANISYLRAAKTGMLLEASAQVVKLGGRVAHLQADVRCGEDCIAKGTFTFMRV